jgi:hypothetical protein
MEQTTRLDIEVAIRVVAVQSTNLSAAFLIAFFKILPEKSAPNNERPETLSSPGRPGSPPPELLTDENKLGTVSCIWHFRAMIPRQSVNPSMALKNKA